MRRRGGGLTSPQYVQKYSELVDLPLRLAYGRFEGKAKNEFRNPSSLCGIVVLKLLQMGKINLLRYSRRGRDIGKVFFSRYLHSIPN